MQSRYLKSSFTSLMKVTLLFLVLDCVICRMLSHVTGLPKVHASNGIMAEHQKVGGGDVPKKGDVCESNLCSLQNRTEPYSISVK